MKIRLIRRIVTAISGVVLLAISVCMALEALQIVRPVTELTMILNGRVPGMIAISVAACLALVLALLGVHNVSLLFHRSKHKRGFITEQGENGDIIISTKSIEELVLKCAAQHEEIEKLTSVGIEETRGGLLIKLKMLMTSGMNIPLAVSTLQKQVKQYVTACTGLDISAVRVQVESSAGDTAKNDSPYAVQITSFVKTPARPVEEPEPVAVPESPVEPAQENVEMPTHQRIFAPEEEQVTVPEPPAEPAPSAEETQGGEEATMPTEDELQSMMPSEKEMQGLAEDAMPSDEKIQSMMPSEEEMQGLTEAAMPSDEEIQQMAEASMPSEEERQAMEEAAKAVEEAAAEREARAREVDAEMARLDAEAEGWEDRPVPSETDEPAEQVDERPEEN